MTRRPGPWMVVPVAASLMLALGMTACSGATGRPEDDTSASPPEEAPAAETSALGATPAPEETGDEVVGTTVRFTTGDVDSEVIIDEDTPTTRSFLAMLPMTLEFSDFGGKEKVATPTGEWDFTDAAGVNPQVGDLFSYMPWGNLGFFYNTEGNTFDASLTRIGSTTDVDQIELLDGQRVTVAIAR
ncbi:cyclophilin-like fold protein [Microbacterium sp. IEGM 1404]|uniref:cyclophilin-like fold protein n=1 Tax=Microbacterium sp. IEGM 1404 TaxID=3047084 RepID=UPI0024B70A15|nr:cyclophilin-like fold protein [Microbacterium sp. IEGM 1404]MDI9892400.1 cyclophilin-like fold protein [Microbacterium sp. IEGM 1404]